MRAEQDKETSGDHLAMMTSMSGFKFAVSFLFNSATEAMATATRRAREVTVLSILWTIQPSKLCKPGVVNTMVSTEGKNSMLVTKELVEKMTGEYDLRNKHEVKRKVQLQFLRQVIVQLKTFLSR